MLLLNFVPCYNLYYMATRVKILIPQPLRGLSKGVTEIEVAAKTVGEAVAALDRSFAGMATRLVDGNNELRKHVLVYVNDNNARLGKGMATRLKNNDIITILPAIAGG
jgi:sulfur-carrier protein